MARRGRKRSLHARRRQTTVRGRRPVDTGTEYARRRRLELVGRADPVLSESALGILYARNWIDESQFKAGGLFASFRQAAYGKTFAPVAHYGDYIDDYIRRSAEDRLSENEPYLVAMTRAYLRGDRALKQTGTAVRNTTWNICILSIVPSWALKPRNAPMGSMDAQDRDDLIEGLDLLTEEYGTNADRAKKVQG